MRSCLLLVLACFVSDNPTDNVVIKDTSAYVEINHIYRHNFKGEIEKRMVQIIWWEWRNQLLLPEKDGAGKYTGNWFRGSGFVVKDYRVTISISSKPNIVRKITPQRLENKWICIFYDKDFQCLREVTSGWIRVTHTLYDREVEDRDFLRIDFRTKLSPPRK